MSKTKQHAAVVAVAMSLGLTALAHAQQPDNTKVNKRDTHPGAVTPDQQTGSRSDNEMTRAVRREIVADKTLSTYAHNVKVVTKAGKVTLRGPVRSEEEKRTVQEIATRLAGTGNVDVQLEIAADANQKGNQ